MATAGPTAVKSEPRRRVAKKKNFDSEDAASTGSGALDGRPNNWDFSGWKPSSVFDERMKKGNPEREKEQSMSMESTPTQERKHRTPHTFPRTRMTANTPASQRIAMENLKQQLLFSGDEISTDGEPNNEKNVPIRRTNPPNYQRQDTSSDAGDNLRRVSESSSQPASSAAGSVTSDGPDSNQIVGRLMQIRDYLKQATVMMENLKMSPDSQETGAQISKLSKLIAHLGEQERGYMDLLQKMLASRDETLLVMENSGGSSNSKIESVAESMSIDVDMRSDISEATTDRSINIRTRPKIESHMGNYSEAEEDIMSARSNCSQLSEASSLSRTLTAAITVPASQGDFEDQESDKGDDLEALRTQHQLLKKMLHQQQQLRSLQERQADLLGLQQNAEQRLADRRRELNEGNKEAEAAVGDNLDTTTGSQTTTQSDTEDTLTDAEIVPEDLKDLRRRLHYLKNIYETGNQSDSANPSGEEDGGNTSNLESEISFAAAERSELRNKLQELQSKKARMDELLQELQSLRSQRNMQLHNDLDADRESTTSSQARINDSITATASANQTAGTATQVLDVLDAKSKMKKLHEVRGRLNQLRDLVQYYQSGTEFIHADGEEQTSLPAYSDYEDPELMLNLRQMSTRGVVASRLKEYAQRNNAVEADQSEQSEAETDTTETESHLSSNLGALGDDPEIQEKVKKLRAAKEKLKRLQELVAMVQQQPDAARVLPDDLAELAASMDGDSTSQATMPSERNYGLNISETDKDDGNEFYELRMSQQQEELRGLMEERRKLLAIQNQLQKLQVQFPVLSTPRDDSSGAPRLDRDRDTANSQETSSSVTFQIPDDVPSNDELWDKMRSQRMLREELRQKKKELEEMMKKDRNKKAYFRNQPQDNQSDTVSYSDQLGMSMISGDVTTMATWGGSTTDNLAGIEEDLGASEDEAEIDDDPYDDGIVQAEEEEEAKSDNNTYTIEDDFRHRQRALPIRFPVVDDYRGRSRHKQSPAYQRQLYDPQDPRSSPYRPRWWSPASRNHSAGYPRFSPRRLRQENYRSAPDIVDNGEEQGNDEHAEMLQEQLQRTSELCQSLLQDQQDLSDALHRSIASGSVPPSNSYRGDVYHDLTMQYHAQMQQQQQLYDLNSCYNQLYNQQAELQRQQDQIHHLLAETQDREQNPDLNDTDPTAYQNPYRPESMQGWFPYAPSPAMPPYYSQSPMFGCRPPSALGYGMPPFNFSPQFPPNFGYTSPYGDYRRSDGAEPDRSRYASTGQQTESPINVTTTSSSRPPAESLYAQQRTAADVISSQDNPFRLTHPTEPAPLPTAAAQNLNIPKLNLEDILRRRSNARRMNPYESSARSQQSQQSDLSSIADRRKFSLLDRPGLSGGISGTPYMDTASISSAVSSVRGYHAMNYGMQAAQQKEASERSESYRESDAPSEFSLFEALRETIYSEVATLISQNENRPHFLIELFRELQMLSSDYLRQRALYAVQDLVTRFLTEESVSESVTAPPPPWLKQNILTASEHTPSESLITTDEEEVRARLFNQLGKNKKSDLKMKTTPNRGRPDSVHSGSVQSDRYDYVENVDNQSSMSTPPSGHWESPFAQDSLGDTVIHLDKDDFLAVLTNQSPFSTLSFGDSPFAQDSLGDTVIHFDKAMQRMREYERKLKEQEGKASGSPAMKAGGDTTSEVTSSSAQDQGSESSVSDVPYPRIDTQQLDRQIKGIMTEVIPVLKEHMDDVCSQQLLSYIERLVLSLTKQRDEGQEFVRFFHKQLGSILQDSLAKFEGRKMRECGEDLLVDMSEILFNELAFFRLMQDLDDPKIKERARKNWSSRDTETSTETSVDQNDMDNLQETTTQDENSSDEEEVDAAMAVASNEEEDLGKQRDDEFALTTDIATPTKQMKIELAVSETKPFTRIGSDEDEDDDDASHSMEDPSETAVSRDAEKERSCDTVVEVNQGSGDAGSKSPEKEITPKPQMNGDIDPGEVTVDDLPKQLTSLNEVELQTKITDEEKDNATAAVLDTMPASGEDELAGDGDAIKEPGNIRLKLADKTAMYLNTGTDPAADDGTAV